MVAVVGMALTAGVLWLLAIPMLELGRISLRLSPVQRFILYPFALALSVVLMPALLLAALVLGYLTPQSKPSSVPFEQNGRFRQGFTGLFDLLFHPWESSTPSGPPAESV